MVIFMKKPCKETFFSQGKSFYYKLNFFQDIKNLSRNQVFIGKPKVKKSFGYVSFTLYIHLAVNGNFFNQNAKDDL